MRFLVVAAAIAALLFTSAPAWPALAQEVPTIVYQSVRCGEDRDVYGRVTFPPGTPSFSVYLQERIPNNNNAGFTWSAIIASFRNIAPAPTDTSADYGPLDTANVDARADRIRVANTLSDDVSSEQAPCQITTPSPTPTATPPSPTATPTTAPTQTPVVVTATATPTPVPTQAPPQITIINNPPPVVAPVQIFPTLAPSSNGTGAGAAIIRPPSTGSGGLAVD